jgi:hypothetical protein
MDAMSKASMDARNRASMAAQAPSQGAEFDDDIPFAAHERGWIAS